MLLSVISDMDPLRHCSRSSKTVLRVSDAGCEKQNAPGGQRYSVFYLRHPYSLRFVALTTSRSRFKIEYMRGEVCSRWA